jgi:GNAT superfamily N-acetyltransferase
MTDTNVTTNAAAALVRALITIARAYESGLVQEVAPGLTAFTTGTPLARMNGVAVDSPDRVVDAGLIRATLGLVRATGMPATVQLLGAGAASGDSDNTMLGALAGTVAETADVVPTMTLDLATFEPTSEAASSLQIAMVTSDEDRADWATVLGAGFGTDASLGTALVDQSTLADPRIVAYLGRVDGAPVATGYMVVDGDWVGVFAIATTPDSRRRGYAEAVTTAIVLEGRQRGARTAYLQASDMGRPLYERLGFRDSQDDTLYYRVRG